MSKSLKTFIVLLFLLSVAALVINFMIFQQKGSLKARILNLEQSSLDFAQSIRYEDLQREALRPADFNQIANMETPLREVAQFGDNLYVDLQNTKTDLENTKIELAATKDELEQTRTQLASAQDRIGVLNTDLADKEQELETVLAKVDDLEQQKEGLLEQITDFEGELAKTRDEIKDLNDLVAQQEKEVRKLYDDIFGPGSGQPVPRGLSGKIVVVKPDWNFVVLDLGRIDQLSEGIEMLVHRGDELLGKIKVSMVEQNAAVADIVSDWELAPIQPGDSVLYELF